MVSGTRQGLPRSEEELLFVEKFVMLIGCAGKYDHRVLKATQVSHSEAARLTVSIKPASDVSSIKPPTRRDISHKYMTPSPRFWLIERANTRSTTAVITTFTIHFPLDREMGKS
eukprot:Blabericola_migrator_1__6751@NODE_340_length_9604_cov_22_008284_g273_i0_p2_GENE_NODE_340_length_9604_cov_22_008284_g273_i0NODE_340_length_9604_cov_22_008284_g273_i0_p2_ORF_typecomplete_len114_score8_11_NODE_340_length_9604_cov_22_008284_g273_i070157356